MNNSSLLEQAAKSITTNSTSQPSPESLVEALLQAEKTAKKRKVHYSFEQLIGTWRLCFVTGTKKTRQRAGIVLGAGRYIPRWVKLQLCYSAAPTQQQDSEAGVVENSVELGALKLTLTGPTKFLPKKNILAFDFTRMTVQLFGAKLYKGYIRGGESKEQQFQQESVGKQAFFAYFLVEDKLIAARGRGGGLALWVK
jgi:hypothetical protein